MKTKDYIKTFNMDHPEGNWNRKKFINALKEEFIEKIELTRQSRIKMGLDYPFRIFQQQVKEIQEKFWSISQHKLGESLSPQLFKAFYGIVVVKIREELFPEEDAKIKAYQEKKEIAKPNKQIDTMAL